MSTKNARTLSIRLTTKEAADLSEFETRTGIDGVSLGRNALRACLDYFRAGGTMTFPLVLAPKSPVVPAYLRDQESPPVPPPEPPTPITYPRGTRGKKAS